MFRVLLVLCALVLAGCASATAADFGTELKTAGYTLEKATHDRSVADGVLTLDITMSHKWTDDDLDEIAQIAWTRYPDDFDELKVVINGKDVMSILDNELRAEFGDRP